MPPRNRRPLPRARGYLEQKSRYLVYTEGSVTEKKYIKGTKSLLGRSAPSIDIGAAHGEPLNLVKAAVSHRDRESSGDPYDYVWCIFDTEAPEPHPSLEDALQVAHNNHIYCAVSGPCFELWLILHFEDYTRWLSTKDAQDRLEKLPCSYSKASKDFDFDKCAKGQEEACMRADALNAQAASTPGIKNKNPWTSVHELIRQLTSETQSRQTVS